MSDKTPVISEVEVTGVYHAGLLNLEMRRAAEVKQKIM